jgi:hypothetical protein
MKRSGKAEAAVAILLGSMIIYRITSINVARCDDRQSGERGGIVTKLARYVANQNDFTRRAIESLNGKLYCVNVKEDKKSTQK